MGKAAWQIATAVAITWAIAASAVAWINKGQIEQRTQPAQTVQPAVAQATPEEALLPPYTAEELAEVERPRGFHPVNEHEQCIGGVVLRKDGNAWTSVTWHDRTPVRCAVP